MTSHLGLACIKVYTGAAIQITSLYFFVRKVVQAQVRVSELNSSVASRRANH